MKFRCLLVLSLVVLLLTVSWFPGKTVLANDPEPTIGTSVQTSDLQPGLQFIGCSPVYLTAVNSGYEQRVAELVNIEREKAGLPPLKRIEALDQTARFHAQDMAVDAYFSHDSYDKTQTGLVKVCGWSTRIAGFYPNYGWLGENIAAGFGTPDDVMTAWMGSDGHRGNILGANYSEFGVGYASGGPYGNYWVQDFGSRSNSYPIVIDLEAAVTDSPQVNLYLYGEGVWNEMRLRSDANAWSDWRAFAKNVTWTLDWVPGVHTISVEYRKTGQSSAAASSSDTIELTTSGLELGNLPNQITFIYERESHVMHPATYELNPLNTVSDLPMNWQVSTPDTWIHISNSSGTTPSGATIIQPDLQGLKSFTELQGSLTIAVSGGIQAIGSPKTISVHLIAVNALDKKLYLPSIRK